MIDDISLDDIESCPTCGHAVVICWNVSKTFIPVSDKKLEELKIAQSDVRE